MSTRSEIAVQQDDGKWMQSYIHFDGYPEHMVAALEPITDRDTVVDIITQGDIVSIENGQVDFYKSKSCSFYNLEQPEQHQEFLYVFEDGAWTVWQ